MKKGLIALSLFLVCSSISCTGTTNNPSNGDNNDPVVDPNPSDNPSGSEDKPSSDEPSGGEDNNPTGGEDNPDKPNIGEDNPSGGNDKPGEEITDPTTPEIKTIKEIKDLCNKTSFTLNQSGIGIDKTKSFTINVRALNRFSLVKTVSKYGLNESTPYKVLVGDESGYIAVASNKLFDKVSSYAGKETSNYTITGYLSMYLNKPELYLDSDSYELKQDMKIDIDYSSYSSNDITIDDYFAIAKEMKYNCAGYGYENIYTVKGVKCYMKRDDTYFFTNGKSMMKVSKANSVFSVGGTYDLTGFISLSRWSPCFVSLKANLSTNEINEEFDALANQTTVSAFKTLQASQDDTDKRFESFTESFKNIYKSEVYVNAYTVNGHYYVTMSDNYHENKNNTYLSSRDSACNTYGMIEISNDNYYNEDAATITKYCSLYPYIGVEEKIEVHYFRYIQEYVNKKPVWKVVILENYLSL